MSDRARLIERLRKISRYHVARSDATQGLTSIQHRDDAKACLKAAGLLAAAEQELARTRDHAHEVGFSEGYNAATKADAEGADGDEGYPGIAHDFNELEKDRDMWKRTCLHYQSLLGERGLL